MESFGWGFLLAFLWMPLLRVPPDRSYLLFIIWSSTWANSEENKTCRVWRTLNFPSSIFDLGNSVGMAFYFIFLFFLNSQKKISKESFMSEVGTRILALMWTWIYTQSCCTLPFSFLYELCNCSSLVKHFISSGANFRVSESVGDKSFSIFFHFHLFLAKRKWVELSTAPGLCQTHVWSNFILPGVPLPEYYVGWYRLCSPSRCAWTLFGTFNNC